MGGLLITFDGPDGSGKTIQIGLLAKYLKPKKEAVLTKNPTDGKIGKLLMDFYLKKTSLPFLDTLLFFADREEQTETIIKPNLKSGKIVISDRYYHCSLVYQNIQGVDFTTLLELSRHFPKPDLTIFLDVSVKTSLDRMRIKKRERDIKKFEAAKFLETVRERYLELPKKLPAENIVIIDGEDSPENIHKKVVKEVEELL